MAVMAVETSYTFSPSKIELKETGKYRKDGKPKKDYRGLTKNEILQLDENFSGAVGLIQFTPVAITDLNKNYNLSLTKRKLALMTNLEQLDYVERYIKLWKNINKIKNKLTLADLYLLVFAPAKMNGSDDNTTLYKEGSDYYNANKSIDTDGKNGITKKELAKRAYDSYSEGKKYKAKEFSCNLVIEKVEEINNKQCPDDYSQCFNYADVWENPEISSDNGGKNSNRYDKGSTRGHKGVDILSGPTYKDVHSLMCGTVEAVVTSYKTNQYGYLKLGNVINIKSKDKDGNIVYILYCHLDKVYVKKGDKVKHGQKIALSGSTGNASDGSLPNGSKGKGIKKENWHVHIEATASGSGVVTFYGKARLQPEDYMKTKFDNKGNAIK